MTGLFSRLIKFIIKQPEVERFPWKIYCFGITFLPHPDEARSGKKDDNAWGFFLKDKDGSFFNG